MLDYVGQYVSIYGFLAFPIEHHWVLGTRVRDPRTQYSDFEPNCTVYCNTKTQVLYNFSKQG